MVSLNKYLLFFFGGKVILSAGAAVNMVDNDGRTALMYAAQNWLSQFAEVRTLM